MESIALTPDNFATEVLQSDKPVVVIVLPINDRGTSDPSDDSIEIFDMPLAEFKSEAQKTAGGQYKIALVDRRYEGELDLFLPVPHVFPPPFPLFVFEKGEKIKSGFLLSFDKDAILNSLKQQLSN